MGVGHVTRVLTLKIPNSTDVAQYVTGVELRPKFSQASVVTCDGDTVNDVGSLAYEFVINYTVDYADGSLYRYLIANHGSSVTYEYTPDPANNAAEKLSGNVRIMAGNANEQAGQFATGTVTLPTESATWA